MKTPKIRFLLAHYSFDRGHSHVAGPQGSRPAIEDMGDLLAGSKDLVGIYIPEGTEDAYRPGPARGRVVGAVRLLAMPVGKTVEDYYYRDFDQSLRWPFGWPCAVVYAPPVENCPSLREHVETLWGPQSFHGFVAPFQKGPIQLDRYRDLKERIEEDFSAFDPMM